MSVIVEQTSGPFDPLVTWRGRVTFVALPDAPPYLGSRLDPVPFTRPGEEPDMSNAFTHWFSKESREARWSKIRATVSGWLDGPGGDELRRIVKKDVAPILSAYRKPLLELVAGIATGTVPRQEGERKSDTWLRLAREIVRGGGLDTNADGHVDVSDASGFALDAAGKVLLVVFQSLGQTDAERAAAVAAGKFVE